MRSRLHFILGLAILLVLGAFAAVLLTPAPSGVSFQHEATGGDSSSASTADSLAPNTPTASGGVLTQAPGSALENSSSYRMFGNGEHRQAGSLSSSAEGYDNAAAQQAGHADYSGSAMPGPASAKTGQITTVEVARNYSPFISPAKIPASLIPPDPTWQLSSQQVSTWSNLQNDFAQTVSNAGQNSASQASNPNQAVASNAGGSTGQYANNSTAVGSGQDNTAVNGGNGQNSANSAYEFWNNAQMKNDEIFKQQFGWAAYRAQSIKSAP